MGDNRLRRLEKGQTLETLIQFVKFVGNNRHIRLERGSLDLLCLKEGHEGLGGSRATGEGYTYPVFVSLYSI